MMITLNLISQQQRQRIRRGWAAAELRSVSVTALFVVVLASATLYGARHLLSSTRDLFDTDVRTTAAATAVAEADAAAAQAVAASLGTDVDWRSFLATVASATPPGVSLDSLAVDDAGAVAIAGEAATRDGLLQLQRNLESSGSLRNLYSPVRNLLQPTDIRFELTAELATSTNP